LFVLRIQIEQLQAKLLILEKSNINLNNELVLSKNETIELNQQLEQIKIDKNKIENNFKQKLEVIQIKLKKIKY
jgi:hypothetical protein